MSGRVSTGVRLHQGLSGKGRFVLSSQNKRVPILLSSIEASTYTLLRDLVAPDAPGTLTFRRLSDVLTAHFEPKRMVITERFYFQKRVETVGESIAEFDAALRKLAIHCEFGRY